MDDLDQQKSSIHSCECVSRFSNVDNSLALIESLQLCPISTVNAFFGRNPMSYLSRVIGNRQRIYLDSGERDEGTNFFFQDATPHKSYENNLQIFRKYGGL